MLSLRLYAGYIGQEATGNMLRDALSKSEINETITNFAKASTDVTQVNTYETKINLAPMLRNHFLPIKNNMVRTDFQIIDSKLSG